MGTKDLIMLVGPPGSGKSTYCKEYLPNYYRISQDDMGKSAHMELFKLAVESESDNRIVIDRMNFNKQQRAKYIPLARKNGYTIVIVCFCVEKAECIKRIKERENHPTLKADKAEEVYDFFIKNFEPPTKDEYDIRITL